MKVTVLVDNLRNGPLKGEWGLSFLIEYEKWKILLDTGASGFCQERQKTWDRSWRGGSRSAFSRPL